MFLQILMAVLAAGVQPSGGDAAAGSGFDRPALLALAPEDRRAALAAADRHILVVRHARKISSDCNGMDCPLSPLGEAMVVRLGEILGPDPVDRAYASAACRTRLTAAAGQADVVTYQALDGYSQSCQPDEIVESRRASAFTEAREGALRWTLAAEHSNTSCMWIEAFAGPAAAGEAGCSEGRLPDTAYGDIYWLYRTGESWELVVLPGAFELAEE